MNIAILANKLPPTSTFIRAHIENLDGRVTYYYRKRFQYFQDEGRSMGGKYKFYFQGGIHQVLRGNPFLAFQKPLLKAWKIENIDIILVEYGNNGANHLDTLKKSGLPFVVHFHGYDASRYDILRKYRKEYREMFKVVNFVIVVSKKMHEMIAELGCPKEKLVLAPYGPNPDFFSVKPEFKKRQFLGLGRFVAKKAPNKTIRAFQKLLKRTPEASLVLAGNGPLLEECKKLVDQLGIADRVQFPGLISPDKFRSLLQESIAFVQHSVRPKSGDMEGTPVAILEATAAGLPVIATRHAGIPDVVIENETGFLVDEGDIEGMAKFMMRVSSDLQLAKKMGSEGRNRIASEYSMEKHIDILNQVLKSAVSQAAS